RFMQEARAASRLNHPAICTIYDVGETEDGRLYIAMAYYDGRTLEEVVLRGGVSLSEALAVVGQLADGLALAHGQGIVHRDVKPANIVVGNDGRAVLLDFGIAKLNGSNLTGTGVRLGTLAYMSPQRLRGEADEELCDVWSLGVILFEMISGTRPFVGTEPHEVMTSILEQEPPALTRYV
ncbi:MAG: serine/threonine protein kinase, partial [Myxococcales bacterium]|nr:serine/threonine protein kinase [Myxococcales bacterium]